MSDWELRKAALAEKFLDYPIESVSRWAKAEFQFSPEQAQKYKEREEEGDF